MSINQRINDNKKKAAIGIIKAGRKVLGNSPVNDWKIASTAKGKIFKFAHSASEVEISYKGISLVAPTRDTCLTPGLVGGYYESIELDIFARIASTAKTIVDVGGNIGLYAALGGVNVSNKGSVYSFEPIPENIDYIKKNLILNGVQDKVHIEPVAVGAEAGMLEIFISKNNVGNHSASRKNVVDANDKVSIKKVTLDSYFNKPPLKGKRIDVLKIDVEGYDGYVLDGAQEIINKYKPTLFIEYIPKLMKNCGYDSDSFINVLFGVYKNCYLVNEAQGGVTEVSQQNIQSFASQIRNSNLIFVDNDAHITIINDFVR